MTPETENELVRLAIKRALDAVNSVNQLMECDEQVATVGLSVIVEMTKCFIDHMVETTTHEDGTPTTLETAKMKAMVLISAALELSNNTLQAKRLKWKTDA
jgi:hypothetical protein